MNKSITQNSQNDKQISESIKRFFLRFHVSSALKASNAYKQKGVPVIEIFQYLFLLIFSNRSMYMCFISGKNTPSFAKDTVYRFIKMLQINWIRFTTILTSRDIRSRYGIGQGTVKLIIDRANELGLPLIDIRQMAPEKVETAFIRRKISGERKSRYQTIN